MTQTTHGVPWHTGRNVHSPVFTAQIDTDSKRLSMVYIQNCSQQTMEQTKVETAGKKTKHFAPETTQSGKTEKIKSTHRSREEGKKGEIKTQK